MGKPVKKTASLAVAAAALAVASVAGCRVDITPDGAGSGGGSHGASGGDSGGSSGGNSGGNRHSGGGSTRKAKVTPSPSKSLTPDISTVSSVGLACPGEGCTRAVTIRSTGTAPLRIYSFVMLDDPNFTFNGSCVNQNLDPGESCTFSVGYQGPHDDSVYSARLVIHQNLPDGPTYISLSETPIPD